MKVDATFSEAARLARHFELHGQRALTGVSGGPFRTRFIGRGLAFEELRAYAPGDDIRDIAWSATARRGEAFVKRFREERDRTVWLVGEDSPRLDFGCGRTTPSDPWFERAKRRTFLESSALVLLAAQSSGDRVGLALEGDNPVVRPPARGVAAVRLIFELLTRRSEKRPSDLKHVIARQRKRCLVIAVSDFLNHEFVENLVLISRRHEVVALRIVDPWEIELPNLGLVRWRDAESGATTVIDTSHERFRSAYQNAADLRTSELRRLFDRYQIAMIDINTSQPFGFDLISRWPSQ